MFPEIEIPGFERLLGLCGGGFQFGLGDAREAFVVDQLQLFPEGGQDLGLGASVCGFATVLVMDRQQFRLKGHVAGRGHDAFDVHAPRAAEQVDIAIGLHPQFIQCRHVEAGIGVASFGVVADHAGAGQQIDSRAADGAQGRDGQGVRDDRPLRLKLDNTPEIGVDIVDPQVAGGIAQANVAFGHDRQGNAVTGQEGHGIA